MTATSATATRGQLVRVPAWAFAVLVLAAFGAYVLFQENGWLVANWRYLHELVHDGRHALGFPCH